MQHFDFDFLNGGWKNNCKNKEDIHLEEKFGKSMQVWHYVLVAMCLEKHEEKS